YIAGAELPCLVVNMVRGGPGLGGIQPAQSDYFQATKGGGHGDYRLVVLAPSTIQEAADLVMDGFDIADTYRNPVMILGDGMLGQMMEPVVFKKREGRDLPEKTWATTGHKGDRPRSIINSLFLNAQVLEQHVNRIYEKYDEIEKKEIRVECYNCEDADIIIAAYGSTARIAKSAIDIASQEGIRVGLIRPITLWPFPDNTFRQWADKDHVKAFLTVEMSKGQMVEDVSLSVNGKKPSHFFGRTGGIVPTPEEIVREVKKLGGGV
ncbi:MAG TPA: transketolase C-terminal domain-containing protein, partial [Bacillota bacterium]|nr:transketolase C-terminal domain-containing protein [Bacillota bacterium]